MTATSTDVVLRVLKQIHFSLRNGGKIAVHCHAGRGRTCLIIAAWLIYSEHMTAKEAIKHCKVRRHDSINKKSQRTLLYRFEKELNELRQIYFSPPRHDLDQYIYNQKRIYPLDGKTELKFVPRLIMVMLERLETLLFSKTCRPLEIVGAFYSLDDSELFLTKWTNETEKNFKKFKDRLNKGDFEVSDIDDPRFCVQAVLDFLDGFTNAAIQQQVVDSFQNALHEQKTLTEKAKQDLFKTISKKEFLLLEQFARFFSNLVLFEQDVHEHIEKAAIRLCISLLQEKKNLDKNFLRRNMLKIHEDTDRISVLKFFLLKWVENFNENFGKEYMLRKAPLRNNTKVINLRVFKKKQTYLQRITHQNIDEELDESSYNQIAGSIKEEDDGQLNESGNSQNRSSALKLPPSKNTMGKIPLDSSQQDSDDNAEQNQSRHSRNKSMEAVSPSKFKKGNAPSSFYQSMMNRQQSSGTDTPNLSKRGSIDKKAQSGEDHDSEKPLELPRLAMIKQESNQMKRRISLIKEEKEFLEKRSSVHSSIKNQRNSTSQVNDQVIQNYDIFFKSEERNFGNETDRIIYNSVNRENKLDAKDVKSSSSIDSSDSHPDTDSKVIPSISKLMPTEKEIVDGILENLKGITPRGQKIIMKRLEQMQKQ